MGAYVERFIITGVERNADGYVITGGSEKRMRRRDLSIPADLPVRRAEDGSLLSLWSVQLPAPANRVYNHRRELIAIEILGRAAPNERPKLRCLREKIRRTHRQGGYSTRGVICV